MARVIMHIDLNAFFVSAELLRHPELVNKPVAVGGHFRRGVLSTASYEARKYGVNSAMPIYQAKKLCPELIILNGDYKYYQDLSKNFFGYLKENVSPIIEMASIDEAFLDLTDVLKDNHSPIEYLSDLQATLKAKFGLSCSIGLGPTKFLAKMASDMKKPMGLTIIRKRDIKQKLFPLPIKDLFGVGKKSQAKLLRLNIKTIGDFYNYNPLELKKIMGKMYSTVINWLNGKGDDVVCVESSDPKSISSSSTFLIDTNNYNEIVDSLKYQVKDIVDKLHRNNMVCSTIHITLRDSEFKTITRCKTFESPLEKESDILEKVLELLDKHWSGNELRLVGASLSSLVVKDNYYAQLNLFNIEQNQKECKTRLLINELNRKSDKPMFMTLKELQKKNNKN